MSILFHANINKCYSVPIKLLALFGLCGPGMAFAETFECPREITVTASTIDHVPSGWNVVNQVNQVKLVSAGIFDGPPAEMASLKPYASKQKNNRLFETWKFEGSYPAGKWLSCSYQGGISGLAKRLPDNVSGCEISYEKSRKNDWQLVGIDCQ